MNQLLKANVQCSVLQWRSTPEPALEMEFLHACSAISDVAANRKLLKQTTSSARMCAARQDEDARRVNF